MAVLSTQARNGALEAIAKVCANREVRIVQASDPQITAACSRGSKCVQCARAAIACALQALCLFPTPPPDNNAGASSTTPLMVLTRLVVCAQGLEANFDAILAANVKDCEEGE